MITYVRFVVDGVRTIAEFPGVSDTPVFGAGKSVPLSDPERLDWNAFHTCQREKDANVQVILSGVKQVQLPGGEVYTFGPGQEHGMVIDFSDILAAEDFEEGVSGHSTRVLVAVEGIKIPRVAA